MATMVLGLTPAALASCSCVMALPRRSLLTFSPVVATAYIIAILLILYSNFAVALETKVKLKNTKLGLKR